MRTYHRERNRHLDDQERARDPEYLADDWVGPDERVELRSRETAAAAAAPPRTDVGAGRDAEPRPVTAGPARPTDARGRGASRRGAARDFVAGLARNIGRTIGRAIARRMRRPAPA